MDEWLTGELWEVGLTGHRLGWICLSLAERKNLKIDEELEGHMASLISPAKMTHKVDVEEHQNRPAFLGDRLDTVLGNEALTADQLEPRKKELLMEVVKIVVDDNNFVGRSELRP